MATSRSSSRKTVQRSAAKKAKRPSTVVQKAKASKRAIRSEITTRRATSGAAEPVPVKRAKIDAKQLRTIRKAAAASKEGNASKASRAAKHTHSSTSKTATVLDMLRRPGGTTIAAITAETGWQPHSVRGFLTAVVRKRLGLDLTSTKVGSERVYRITEDGAAVPQVNRGHARRVSARG